MKITSYARILIAMLFALSAGAAQAQAQSGTVTGRVLEEATGRALVGVEVSVQGTRLATVTDESGRFLFVNVPVGTQEVRVQLIGYGQTSQTVTVVAGQTATANFTLRATAIALEQVVVTGTVGATQRAKLPIVVDQIRAADLPVPSVSAGGAIQGKVAGATVTTGTGRPGAAPVILLRGPTSINASGRSQEPLYIVDGVILSASMVDFDALDIETIEVVKGAAGASLYGSRAQAGVINVTTRRGASVPMDQVRYSLRTEYGQNRIGNTPEAMFGTVHQFQIQDGRFVAGTTQCPSILECPGAPNLAGQQRGQQPWRRTAANPNADANRDIWNTFAIEPFPGPIYDQVDRFFHTGTFAQHYISAEGRAGATNFNVSYSNLNDSGIMRGQDGFRRHNFRLNLDQAVRNDVTVSASAFYSLSDQSAFPESSGNPVFNLTRVPAGVNLFACEDDVAGNCLDNPSNLRLLTDPFSREASNPLYDLLNRDYVANRGRFIGNANVNYRPLSWLGLDANMSYDRFDYEETDIRPKGYRTITPNPSLNLGALSRYVERTEGLNGSLTGTLTHQLTPSILNRTQLRYLFESREFVWTNMGGSQFAVAEVYTFGNTDRTRLSAGSSSQPIRADGYFAITNFDIADRYIIDALVRNDGSSLFGADQRRQWYYRLAGAWRVGEEPWFNFGGIDEFKLRYSYGTAGGRPNFSAQYETYTISAGAPVPVALGNRDLRPEFTREHEAGFDAAFLGNRLMASLTYADALTTDQILQVPLPAYQGFGSQWRNAGALASNTWEASLDARLMQTRNLNWTARVLYDRTRQHITELSVPPYTTGFAPRQGLEAVFYVRPGEPLGQFYGMQIATTCAHLPVGLDCGQFATNSDGLLVWVGQGGSLSNPQWGVQAPTDVTIGGARPLWGVPVAGECEDAISGNRTNFCPLGNGLPAYKLSFSSNLNWRGFGIYGLVDSWQDFQVYNQPLQWAIFKDLGGIMDQTGVAENLQRPVGYYGQLYNVSGLRANSFFVEDGSFVKLRELSLRYRLAGETLDRIPGLNTFTGVTFNVIGRNLATWTNYRGFDPEVGIGGGQTGSAALGRVEGYQYPPFRTWTLSLDLNF
jgi:TonB-linked SusC/RagA family outer membrane protein